MKKISTFLGWLFFGKKGSYRRQFVHNVFVHPLMMFMPAVMAGRMHDNNFEWAFGNTEHKH